MATVTLNNGVEMPTLGLGVFQTPPDETRDAVVAALSSGYRHVARLRERVPANSVSTRSTC